MKFFRITLLTMVIPLVLNAQNSNSDKNYLWKAGAHVGSSMLWGDLSDDQDPFTKMFSSQSKLSYEFDLQRKISNVFGLQGSFLFGKLAGQRTTWSDAKAAGIGFNTSYMDFSLALTADITALFGAKPDRLISFYLLGGGGWVNYDAKSYKMDDGSDVRSAKAGTFFVPWGWGLGFNLTPRLTVFAQNTFRHPFVDDFDSYIGIGSKTDDIYSFTSLGLSYKFGVKKPKKKKIEVVPVKPDTSHAKEYIPVAVNTNVAMPLSLKPNELKTVNVSIDKGNLTDDGEFVQTFPDGFMVESKDNAGGVFTYDNNKLSIRWQNLPESNTLNFSYNMKVGDVTAKTYTIPGTFVYTEENQIKVKQFKNQVMVEGPAVAATQGGQTQGEQNKEGKTAEPQNGEAGATPVTPNTSTAPAGISYAVQVAAVYGGKMNPMGLQKQYHLNESVTESSYKGYNNYTVGNFETYQAADERRKGTKVRGAYVVAFKDGQYQPHLYYVNADVMDKAPFLETGTTYKVQVLANNGRPYAIVKLAAKLGVNANELYEDKYANWYQYTLGKYSTAEEAAKYAKELRAKGFDGAYVVKFVNGKRTR